MSDGFGPKGAVEKMLRWFGKDQRRTQEVLIEAAVKAADQAEREQARKLQRMREIWARCAEEIERENLIGHYPED